ncbi:unnamed protein product [Adineta steineri]|uniref:Uncharacterized protein n=1 Tax=Adineta steineri TaxID=433720 RepID=A0A815S1K1_9BILA|nr:unnamed protein product [Adineta steineri]CAF4329279.1 unnamed protein product [Adineta steineri]
MTFQVTYYQELCIFLLVVIGVSVVSYVNSPNLIKFSTDVFSYTRYSLSKSNEQYTTTVVIVYFPLSKSKQSKVKYQSWIENLLGFCQLSIIIYTSIEYPPILPQLPRNKSLMTHFIMEYNSSFQIPSVKKLIPIFEQQYPSDPERAYHSIGLYAVWCAKPFILNRSVELNPFRTKYFVYIDAGAFRSSNYRSQS